MVIEELYTSSAKIKKYRSLKGRKLLMMNEVPVVAARSKAQIIMSFFFYKDNDSYVIRFRQRCALPVYL